MTRCYQITTKSWARSGWDPLPPKSSEHVFQVMFQGSNCQTLFSGGIFALNILACKILCVDVHVYIQVYMHACFMYTHVCICCVCTCTYVFVYVYRTRVKYKLLVGGVGQVSTLFHHLAEPLHPCNTVWYYCSPADCVWQGWWGVCWVVLYVFP